MIFCILFLPCYQGSLNDKPQIQGVRKMVNLHVNFQLSVCKFTGYSNESHNIYVYTNPHEYVDMILLRNEVFPAGSH